MLNDIMVGYTLTASGYHYPMQLFCNTKHNMHVKIGQITPNIGHFKNIL